MRCFNAALRGLLPFFCYAKSPYPLAVTWSSRAFSIASLPILPVLGEIVRKKQFSIVFYFTNLPEGGKRRTDVWGKGDVSWTVADAGPYNMQTDVRWEAFPYTGEAMCRRMFGARQNTSSTANAVPLLPLEKANVQTNVREATMQTDVRGERN